MIITKDFADGARLLTEANAGETDKDPMNRGTKALRDIADDLATLKVATITSADAAAAAGDPPTKAEFDVVVTLINEIKTKLNAIAAGTILTTKGSWD